MNKVIHGDCLEVMPTLPEKSIDMVLCDLPYGTTACKWDTVIPFEPLWLQYKRLIRDNGAIVLFGSEPFSSLLRMSNLKDYKYDWIWKKNYGSGSFHVKYKPLQYHEIISVFCKKTPIYNPQYEKYSDSVIERFSGNPKVNNKNQREKATTSIYGITQDKQKEYFFKRGKYPSSLLDFKCVCIANKNKLHPTQKPVDLFEYLIKTYTNEGKTVLDNCAGSGTTAIACLNTNRNYILIEKEKEYIDKTNKRIAEHEQQQTLFDKN